jgi:phage portal protein BeeE
MEEILHLRAMSFDGITGIPLSYIAADAIGLATAAQQALSRLYRNGSFVNGYLSHPKSLSQPARQRLRADWEGRFSGSENAGKTPVLGQAYHRNCISNQIEMWQQGCEMSLLSEEEQDQFEIKINPAALLRGSMADQGEYFAKALGSGGQQAWMTPNEIREAVDMPPHPDGDKLVNPMTAPAATTAGDPASAGATANG